VDCGQAALDNIWAGGGTLCFFTYLQSYGGGTSFGRFIDKANNTSATSGFAFQCHGGAGNNRLRFEVGFSGGEAAWRPAVDSLSLFTTYHIALTYNSDSAANDPLIYMDGVLAPIVVEASPSGTYNSDAAYNMRFGNAASTTARPLFGAMYDIRAYSTILPAQRIADISDSDGRDSNMENCISMWPTQDGPVGNQVGTMHDIVGGNHGTPTANAPLLITQWGGMNRRAVAPPRLGVGSDG